MKYIWILAFVSCGGSLSAESKTDIDDAVKLTAGAYRNLDAGTAPAALIRQAHCNIQAVIRNEHLDTFDGGIPCQ